MKNENVVVGISTHLFKKKKTIQFCFFNSVNLYIYIYIFYYLTLTIFCELLTEYHLGKRDIFVTFYKS